MFASGADEGVGLLVGVYRGATTEEEDYVRCLASIAASDVNAARRGLSYTCVLVTDGDTPPPPAVWRQRMANATNAFSARNYYFALVSPKVVIRGVFTAVTWLTRGRPGQHLAAFADLGQATAWVQTHAGHTPIAIRRLYEQALQQMLPMQSNVRSAG
jgi:hypothetical protein